MGLTPTDMRYRPVYDLLRRVKDADMDLHTIKLAAMELTSRHIRLLAPFVDDPEEFMHFIEDRGACIAGSFVTAYIDGDGFPPPQDLDIFHTSAHRTPFLAYFLHIGYVQLPVNDVVDNDTK